MKAYLVGFSSRSNKNSQWIDKYSCIASNVLKKYEGKVLIIGKPETILSGNNWERLTIIEFPSLAKLKCFNKDLEYSKVKNLRIKNTIGEMYFFKEIGVRES